MCTMAYGERVGMLGMGSRWFDRVVVEGVRVCEFVTMRAYCLMGI
jgi:hypothetical protein